MSISLPARIEWRIYRELQKKRLKNKTPTILSSNCNGAFILHDLECKFNTPTVNLYFGPKDFLKFISDPLPYLQSVPEEIPSVLPYPVGKLLDIKVYFMHYKSFEEAKKKWIERSSRVDFNNCFVMMTDKNGCSYEDIVTFDRLPYKNKVIFTHRPYPEISSAFCIHGFEEENEVGILSDFKPGLWRRRWLDTFDYVSFLNGEGIKK